MRRRDLEQLEDDRLIGTEQLSTGNTEEQAVADLAGCAGDGDTSGFLHGDRLLMGRTAGAPPTDRYRPTHSRPPTKRAAGPGSAAAGVAEPAHHSSA